MAETGFRRVRSSVLDCCDERRLRNYMEGVIGRRRFCCYLTTRINTTACTAVPPRRVPRGFPLVKKVSLTKLLQRSFKVLDRRSNFSFGDIRALNDSVGSAFTTSCRR